MIRIGLSSTALLAQDHRELLRAAASAGFDGVEWAEGAYAPLDDPRRAEALLMDTLREGLTVASYASLFRASAAPEARGSELRFAAVLEAAARIQAPNVRIFAGGRRARPFPPARDPALQALASESRRLGDLAAKRGVTLCVAPCRNTWVDSYEAASALVAAVSHPFVRLAWEPLPGTPAEAASASLERLSGAVSLVVARKLGRDGSVGRLADDEAEWRRRLAAFKAAESDPKMCSFVIVGAARNGSEPGLAAAGLEEDARFLKALAAEAEGRASPGAMTRRGLLSRGPRPAPLAYFSSAFAAFQSSSMAAMFSAASGRPRSAMPFSTRRKRRENFSVAAWRAREGSTPRKRARLTALNMRSPSSSSRAAVSPAAADLSQASSVSASSSRALAHTSWGRAQSKPALAAFFCTL